MSRYWLNKIMYLLEVDEDFLARMKTDPAGTIKDMDLTEEERTAVLSGDVGKLYLMGVNPFILDSLARHKLFGLDRDSYLAKVRKAAAMKDQTEPTAI